jgi:ABC-type antimicrobial peptide transport system permease subunit
VYLPYAQSRQFNALQVTARTMGEPAALAGALRNLVASLDPGVPLSEVRTMDQVVTSAIERPRMITFLMLTFAGLATVLAAIGLYGVLSYAVSQRVREIGVRVAIGAHPGDVVGLVVGQGVRLYSIGLVIGLAAALGGGRVLSGLLYEIPAADPVSLACAAGLLGTVALLACALPALRATSVPPSEALRVE